MKSGGGCPLLLLLSSVGLLFLIAQLPGTSGQNTTEKAGSCPQTQTVMSSAANCTEECQTDAACEENRKCCPADKPGSCPKFTDVISPLGFCQDKCLRDSDCESTTKCCLNGCGKRSCLPPDL
ncbi:waprin-Phi1-like isoform X2 [Paroedura picta]|uniref:waprin-Phi1-like isoform X2 n=1 Tax=Paroedura picta TaxID=143630 RepID=UPI00405606C5